MNAFDPYDVLGIDRDATESEVKMAFRKRAKESHPDSGGDRNEFEAVTKAHLVLKDPKKRSKYDRTGKIDDETPDNTVSAAMQCIASFIAMAVSVNLERGGVDPLSIDLVKEMRTQFREAISKIKVQKNTLKLAAKKTRAISERMKRKKGDSPLNKVLEWQSRRYDEQISIKDQEIKAHEDAIVLLGDYEFTSDVDVLQELKERLFR